MGFSLGAQNWRKANSYDKIVQTTALTLLVLPVLYRTFHRKKLSRSARSICPTRPRGSGSRGITNYRRAFLSLAASSHMLPFQIIELVGSKTAFYAHVSKLKKP